MPTTSKFNANTYIPPHIHEQGKKVTVLSGLFEMHMKVPGKEATYHQLTPGQSIIIPARVIHDTFTPVTTIVEEEINPCNQKQLN